MGSDEKGNPIEQHFTQEALSQIADELNSTETEVLMDKDHASARKGLERDTQSLGWFSKFVASAKGLFGLLKLTKKGREMIEGREYRHVSPVFALNEDKEPIRLLSVAATNTPAIRVPENVILNAEPEQSNSEVSDKSEALHMDITKEELVELIKSTVTTLNAEPSTTEEVVVNQGDSVSLNQGNEPTKPNEPVCNETTKDSAKEDSSKEEETSTSEEKTEKTSACEKTSTCDVSDKAETPKTEPEKDAKASEKDDEPEVIQEEVLNSAPTTSVPPVSENEEWRNLSGKAFRDWCSKHAEFCRNYRGE